MSNATHGNILEGSPGGNPKLVLKGATVGIDSTPDQPALNEEVASPAIVVATEVFQVGLVDGELQRTVPGLVVDLVGVLNSSTDEYGQRFIFERPTAHALWLALGEALAAPIEFAED